MTSPRDETEYLLRDIWRHVLRRDGVGVGENFFDLGGHSLLAARLTALVSETTGRDFPLADFLQEPTIEGMARRLRAPAPASADRDAQEASPPTPSPLAPLRRTGTRPPLFVVDPISVWSFADVARALGDDQPVWGLHPLPLLRQGALAGTLSDLAARYVTAVRTVRPKGPYLLCGLCVGGVVSFEMARQILAQGEDIALLVLLDSFCPRRGGALRWGAERAAAALAGGARWLGRTVALRAARVALVHGPALLFRRGGLSARKEYVRAHLRAAARATSEQVRRRAPRSAASGRDARDLEAFRRRLNEMNRRLVGRYAPKPVACPVALFRAEDTIRRGRDRRLGWQRLARGGLTVHEMPGEHHLMLREPHVRTETDRLGACVEEALVQRAGEGGGR